uniref:Uncharacterized protein n=1 Tax=Candidozyma auris TaxID=498019 RepID=A0A0L0NW14_CANAR
MSSTAPESSLSRDERLALARKKFEEARKKLPKLPGSETTSKQLHKTIEEQAATIEKLRNENNDLKTVNLDLKERIKALEQKLGTQANTEQPVEDSLKLSKIDDLLDDDLLDDEYSHFPHNGLETSGLHDLGAPRPASSRSEVLRTFSNHLEADEKAFEDFDKQIDAGLLDIVLSIVGRVSTEQPELAPSETPSVEPSQAESVNVSDAEKAGGGKTEIAVDHSIEKQASKTDDVGPDPYDLTKITDSSVDETKEPKEKLVEASALEGNDGHQFAPSKPNLDEMDLGPIDDLDDNEEGAAAHVPDNTPMEENKNSNEENEGENDVQSKLDKLDLGPIDDEHVGITNEASENPLSKEIESNITENLGTLDKNNETAPHEEPVKDREAEEVKNEADEKDRLEAEQVQRIEQERGERERVEAEKSEEERRKAEKAEQERLVEEKAEQERQEQAEQERLEQERLEQEILEKEKLEQERLEQERFEQERLEQERLEQERLEQERLEQERLEQQKLEQERLERERLEIERFEKEKLEKQKLAQERLEQERLEQGRLENERLEQERVQQDQERLEKEIAEKETLASERAEQEGIGKERLEEERLDGLPKNEADKGIAEGENLTYEKDELDKVEELLAREETQNLKQKEDGLEEIAIEDDLLGDQDLDIKGIGQEDAKAEETQPVTKLDDLDLNEDVDSGDFMDRVKGREAPVIEKDQTDSNVEHSTTKSSEKANPDEEAFAKGLESFLGDVSLSQHSDAQKGAETIDIDSLLSEKPDIKDIDLNEFDKELEEFTRNAPVSQETGKGVSDVAECPNEFATEEQRVLAMFSSDSADFKERLMIWKGWQVDMTSWTSQGFPPKVAL